MLIDTTPCQYCAVVAGGEDLGHIGPHLSSAGVSCLPKALESQGAIARGGIPGDLRLRTFSETRSCKSELLTEEERMHFHLCLQCRVVIAVDEGRACPHSDYHEEGL